MLKLLPFSTMEAVYQDFEGIAVAGLFSVTRRDRKVSLSRPVVGLKRARECLKGVTGHDKPGTASANEQQAAVMSKRQPGAVAVHTEKAAAGRTISNKGAVINVWWSASPSSRRRRLPGQE